MTTAVFVVSGTASTTEGIHFDYFVDVSGSLQSIIELKLMHLLQDITLWTVSYNMMNIIVLDNEK